jgi:hypothetical protein
MAIGAMGLGVRDNAVTANAERQKLRRQERGRDANH